MTPAGEPRAAGAGYSGTPLARKLGIKPGSSLGLIDAPEGFLEILEGLPDGVLVRESARGRLDVIVAFFTAGATLRRRFPALGRALVADGGLWIAWPKRGSDLATDLGVGLVREVGLANGLVDNKICAIDATWSGLRFVVRLADRPARAAPRSGGAS